MRLINSEVRFLRRANGSVEDRGYEQQRYLFHDDGTLALNALSFASDRNLVRDVVVNLDANQRPIDSYVRIHHGTRVEGAGWYRFEDGAVTADLWNTRKGVTRERVEASGRIRAFITHPIACDVLTAAAFDRCSADRVQHVRDVFMSSSDPFGAVGPEIARVDLEIEYVGVESIETAAGVFETDHWRILPGAERTGHAHPGEDLWALRDTFIFIRAEVSAIGFEYQLVSFNERQV